MRKTILFIAMMVMLSSCASQLETLSESGSSKTRDLAALSEMDTAAARQLVADSIESDIRLETKNSTTMSLSREKDYVIVLLKGEQTFDENSSKLSPQMASELDRIAQLLKSYPKLAIRIEGHTDNTGPEWYNLKLSRLRAEVVKSVFIKHNFKDSQISVMPFGESYPIASNNTVEGRKMNRRIVIRVSPSGAN